MRRLLGRWVAIIALVAGVGVGASTASAAAAPAAAHGTSSVASQHRAHANDWWY